MNNGVYKAGFATRQRAYEHACRALFNALDQLEMRLTKSRYLFGDRIVESDWRLFCTLIRFDIVYYIHFKCSLRRILDYPNLQGYLMDLYQQPGIAETVNFDHIKRHYYMTHDAINPTRIVPIGPILELTAPTRSGKVICPMSCALPAPIQGLFSLGRRCLIVSRAYATRSVIQCSRGVGLRTLFVLAGSWRSTTFTLSDEHQRRAAI